MTLNIIILAGGKGTRIRNVLNKTPKIMAPVAGKPFLDWLLIWIDSWNLDIPKKIFLSTCIGHEYIKNYCDKKNISNLVCFREKKPLGTFGALANVATHNISDQYLTINGDTIFKADMRNIYDRFNQNSKNQALIVLKESSTNDRYGGYVKTDQGWIFSQKNTKFISLGAFFITYNELKNRWIKSTNIPFKNHDINNIDREFMIDNSLFGNNEVSAEVLESNTPFLDIGIPETLKEAQTFIPKII